MHALPYKNAIWSRLLQDARRYVCTFGTFCSVIVLMKEHI